MGAPQRDSAKRGAVYLRLSAQVRQAVIDHFSLPPAFLRDLERMRDRPSREIVE